MGPLSALVFLSAALATTAAAATPQVVVGTNERIATDPRVCSGGAAGRLLPDDSLSFLARWAFSDPSHAFFLASSSAVGTRQYLLSREIPGLPGLFLSTGFADQMVEPRWGGVVVLHASDGPSAYPPVTRVIDRAGSHTLVTQVGGQVPGLAEGWRWRDVSDTEVRVRSDGSLVLFGSITAASGALDTAVVELTPTDQVRFAARGLASFGGTISDVLAADDLIAVSSFSGESSRSVHTIRESVVTPLLATGDALPEFGPGASVDSLRLEGINRRGDVLIRVLPTPPGLGDALIVCPLDETRRIALPRRQPLAPGITMNSVWKAAINGRGTVLALASGDEGTDDSATHALVMVRNGATSVLAVVGESINTDMGPVTLSAIFNPSLNAQDQCTMTARIRPLRPGPDVDALFAWDPESGWHLLARDGTPARRTNSAMATLTNVMWFLSFPISGGEDDRATFLSNSGRVVFEAASEDLSYYVLTTQIPSFGAGDTNGDGRVDSADLSVVLSQFGNTVPPGAPGDLNADAVVNAADLSVLLSLIPT